MSSSQILNQPVTLPNGGVIKHRIMKSAMSEAMALPGGRVSPGLIRLYELWAQGGLGLCITGNVMVDRRARGEPGNVVIEDEQDLAGLSAWAQAATQNGMQCWVQLNHPGKQAPKGLNAENVAPSAVPFKPEMQAFFPTPRALSAEEVHEIVARFGRAAGIVKKAGFSGVQIHGAHGYLVSQFLSPHHNQRTDEWGGSDEKRRRFVLAVLQSMRDAVGPDFPIGIKLNSADFQRGGFTEEESLAAIQALEAAGIDHIEISGGTYEAPAMTGVSKAVKASTQEREAYFLTFAQRARAAVKVPLAVTGGFRTAQGMADAVASGAVDMVGLARALAIEPDVIQRFLAGEAPRHVIKPRRTHIPMIDRMALMEVSWYTAQLKRMGRGEPPRPNESPLWVFLRQLPKQLGWGRGKAPKRLRAS